ncbi:MULTISPECIES: glycosyltransferase family 2 protein [Cryobacterium]|uniref:Glycosyltransferase family 2 protein n=1 Tax=Cryobacterium glucosi TaxID=1259175 RepID=A0ABY2INW3_9MICO|nr:MULTISPECIES: glycosyltransferase family 2 protein [Cryobacterium]TFB97990.1 glycosyltransferase family 2 protein [Cryobacterium sp. MDB2-A-1]TFC10924.1 glycosyltransferase family 2 protein [Cryobacterium sp. MDB2-A-2]TFC14401.1 glycosyltransferase family 2 protein [Cryobacterium sp. MDB2-10]TFC19365.1 glycosyltransferase family 2 protein [Cryobacterium glucosi]
MTGESTPPSHVSVALCTYNGAAYVGEQLASILGQTLRPDQIVVSDDGSNDATLDVIDRVVREWRRTNAGLGIELVIIRNPEPLGVAVNFEQALGACTGDLLALSDQDDVWKPNRLERMKTEFGRRPELLLVHTDARLVDGDGHPLGITLLQTLGVTDAERTLEHQGRAFELLLRRNIVTGATTMLRRELLERARPFPGAWVHDEWLAIVAAATGSMDLLDEQLVDYRQHGGNQIGVTTLDAAGRLGRLQASRSERNQRLLERAEVLAQRAPELAPQPGPTELALINDKLDHELMRSSLPAAYAARILPVVREWRTGRYARFGRGAQDVLRDLVQPV